MIESERLAESLLNATIPSSVVSDHVVPGLRNALVPHHPAGAKAFFWQWLYSYLSLEPDLKSSIQLVVEKVCIANLRETFVLNRHSVQSDFHLNRKQKTRGLWRIIYGSTLTQEVEQAAVCLSRWQARTPGYRLNLGMLNAKRLPNLRISQQKFAMCCQVSTRYPTELGPFFKLSGQHLNQSRLIPARPSCHIQFRQRDFLSFGDRGPVESVHGRTYTLQSRTVLSQSLRLGYSALGEHKLSGTAMATPILKVIFIDSLLAGVRASYHLVHRWQAPGSCFKLNHSQLDLIPYESQGFWYSFGIGPKFEKREALPTQGSGGSKKPNKSSTSGER